MKRFNLKHNVGKVKYLVSYHDGETDYNAPDGYYYSKIEKRHVKEEENA